MKVDLKSWLMGFVLGLCGKPLPFIQRKIPTAYSYNGVILPKLPEWDQQAYPYAVLDFNMMSTLCVSACLYVSDVPLYRVPEELEITGLSYNACSKADGSAICYEGKPGGSFARAEEKDITITAGKLISGITVDWASYDFCHATDGTVFLAASEPVPVYE